MAFCYRSDPSAGLTLGKEKMENKKQEKKVASACNITVSVQSSYKAKYPQQWCVVEVSCAGCHFKLTLSPVEVKDIRSGSE